MPYMDRMRPSQVTTLEIHSSFYPLSFSSTSSSSSSSYFSSLLFFFHSLTSSPKFSPVLVLDMNFSILIFLFLFHLDFLISMSHFRFPSIFLLFIPKLALYFLFLSLSFPSFRYCVPLHLCLSYLHGHIGGFKP